MEKAIFLYRNLTRRIPLLGLMPISGRASSTYKAHEKSRTMQKLINKKGSKTKKQWFKSHLGEPMEVETRKTKKGISHGHSVRVRQLSHVLYGKVTEIVSTGELSMDILEKQVSITSVKMTKDLNSLNIYWNADRKDCEEVEQMLQAHSGKLRSLLISYHVLGRIPHIMFVKDKSEVDLNHLSQLFDAADYGPDYVRGKIQSDRDWEDEFTNPDAVLNDSRADDSIYSNSAEPMLYNEFDIFIHELHGSVADCGDISSPAHGEQQSLGMKLDGDARCGEFKDLNFRSDLYGLNRVDIMKKILAKKTKRMNLLEEADNKPSLDLIEKSDMMPPTYSPIVTKLKLKQKLAKEERKIKERMLERHDYES